MEEDSLIRLLYYRNPHLFWVEVKNVDTYSLRQVGLFGVVPTQVSFVDGERICIKSDRWDPRANDIVEEFLEAKHLTFKTTYRLDDEQKTIFNNQHIFGEVSSVRRNVKKQLSNCLDSSVYAYKNKKEFWQMLDEGKIRIELNEQEEIDVLENIINVYKENGLWYKRKSIFLKHLSPRQLNKLKELISEEKTEKLTIENLEKHRIMTNKSHDEKYIGVIEKPDVPKYSSRSKKYQDFNVADSMAPVEFVENVIKKYTVIEKSTDSKARDDTESRNTKITVYDEEINADSGDEVDNQFLRTKGRANTRKHMNKVIDKNLPKINMYTHTKYDAVSTSSKLSNESNGKQKCYKESKNTKTQKEMCESLDILEAHADSGNNAPVKYVERLVAYGPPTNNQQNLVRKVVMEKIEQKIANPPKEDDEANENGKVKWSNDDSVNLSEEFCKRGVNDGSKHLNTHEINIDVKGGINETNLKDNSFDRSIQDSTVKEAMFYKKLNVKKVNTPNQNNENKNPKPKNALLDKIRKRNDKLNDSSSTDNSVKNEINLAEPTNENSDEELEKIHALLQPKHIKVPIVEINKKISVEKDKADANPFKNLDGGKSVFVENLVQPLILAHSKNNTKIFPRTNMRDIPFKVEILQALRAMRVREPLRLQSVSWSYILGGHSLFMISPSGSGKTLGYLPAICNLVLDYNYSFSGLGPICIIICATAVSVANVADMCKMFVNRKVVQCYPGLDNTALLIDIVNGCDILVSTASMLYRLLGAEIGVDLRRLTTVVFDDCEFLAETYELEMRAIQICVTKMLKSRVDKQVKVQYVLASRKWCNMMEPLAKKSPNTIMVFTAFHECVLYSKTKTSVSFVKKDNKVDAVIEFLKETDDTKLTVIVCRSDDEVDHLKAMLDLKFNVTACNNQMNIHDLYKIRSEELTSILICCDGNLKQLNVTSANYLVHFSMPAVYTQFCARFSVLNDNYPSIFRSERDDVKIKILLEETNVEQLPKILNFVKRCSDNVPDVLQEIARKVLHQKDMEKAKILVPICDNFFLLGECVDVDVCQCRHAILEGYDEPKAWMPRNGIITFKIIHYNTATSYSARLLTHSVGADKTRYPETYGTLCLKLGLYFSKEDNKRLHGEPNIGDICAVPIRKNFIARCRVIKINSYEKGKAKFVVINLIDEEKIAVVKAVELYYLPEKFRSVETHVVKVQLAGVRPQDKDVTLSALAMNKLKKITDDDDDLFLKGNVAMTIGNTIVVTTLEACAELSALNETVVKHDYKKILLSAHAEPHQEHLSKLQKLCDAGNLKYKEPINEIVKIKPPVKKNIEYRWAHLDKNDWTEIVFSNTIDPTKFFVRPQKFNKCITSLISDIKKHVEENPKAVDDVAVNDIVLAEFPDDNVYERAIIEEIIDKNKIKCFFVDNADWRDVAIDKIKPIPQKFAKQIPFQTIECRLVGVKPPGEEWTEFSTNWLHDNCLEDSKGNSKRLFVKYFTKEPAEMTGGYKYGVVLVDTTDEDVLINKKMIELNLAAANETEIEYLEKPLDFVREKTDTSSYDELDELDYESDKQIGVDKIGSKDLSPIKMIPNENDWTINEKPYENDKVAPFTRNNDIDSKVRNVFTDKPIRSIPLVGESDEDEDKWDVCFAGDLSECFGMPKLDHKNDDSNEFVAVALEDANDNPKPKKNNEDNKDCKITKEIEKNDAYVVHTKSEQRQTDKTSNKNIKDNKDSKTTIENEKNANAVHTKSEQRQTDKSQISIETMKTASRRLKLFAKHLKNDKDANKIENASNSDVLKGEIKDVSVSLYDSDDTLSITTVDDTIEITMEPNKVNRELTVLDSDDTQSASTLSTDGKDLSIKKEKNLLDSDDSETEDERVKRESHVTKTMTKRVNNYINNSKQIGKQNETGIKGKVIPIKEITKEISNEIVEDKLENVNTEKEHKEDKDIKGKTIIVTQTSEPTRTPQLIWKQDKNIITIKIKVIVDEYTLESGDRSLKFTANQNEVKYAFDIELYGVVENNKTTHANKGQYILVTLTIMLKKTRWLKLTKEYKHWIVYDVDSIDTSSDEETPMDKDALKIIMDKHERAMEDDDDDVFDDTTGFQ